MEEQKATMFRDASDLAIIAIVALAAGALLNVGLFGWGAVHFEDGALPVPPQPLRDLQFLIRVIAAGAFIAWLNRVYANVEALYGETTHERFWAIAGFFVPPFLFFRPCEIAAEAWRRSSRKDDPPILVFAWWTAFVIAPILSITGRRPMAQLFGIIASALAVSVVLRITIRQRAARSVVAAARRAELRSRPPVIPSESEGSGRVGRPDATHPPRSLAPARDDKEAVRTPPHARPVVTAKAPQSHDDVWARILSVALAIAALTMLAVALAIVFHPGSEVVAGVYATFAFLLLVLAFVVGRHRVERNSLPDGWVKIAIFGMAVVAANIIVSIGAAVR